MNQARMSPERWREIKPLLESALELKVEDRRAFLDKTCGEDKALRREVESLLDASEQAGDFMNKPAIEEAARMLAEDNASNKRWSSAGTLFSDQWDFPVASGETLDGRYLIEGKLGESGGMGQVFLARNLKLPGQPHVAIKVLRAQILESEDRDWFEEKFRAEIEALARINHPGVVHALDAGQFPDGRTYVVMQYVPGRTLRSAMPAGGMDFKRAADLLRKIAQPLDAAHEKGVIHRDLKPANVMLQFTSGEEYVKIIDFGIATVLGTTVAQESMETRPVGTFPYMAPEQLQGRPAASSDIFALGVIAFEMVSGQLPFKGNTTDQQIELHRAGVGERLRDLRADLPQAARAAILKAIAYEASDRYATAREFSEAFDRGLAEPDRPEAYIPTSLPSAARRPVPRRRRWALLAMALIVLFAAAAVTVIWPRLSLGRNLTHVKTDAKPPAPAERVLTYSLEALKNPERHPHYSGGKPFIPHVESVFEAGDQVRLRVSSPQAGYLYVVDEGPERAASQPDYFWLFPHPDESAQFAANQSIQIPTPSAKPEMDWIVFDNDKGVEKIWLIWSEHNVAELGPLKKWANPQSKGRIRDPGEIIALARYLKTLAETKVEAEQDEANSQTTLRSRGEVLWDMVKLEHR